MTQDWTFLKPLAMDGTPHEQLVWKLSIMATKQGLKPAFLYSEFTTIGRGKAVSDCVQRIGLVWVLAKQRELVDLSPAEIARYTNHEGAGLWIYRRDDGNRFREELTRYLLGESNITQGALLGYPPCCVKWYEHEVEIPQGVEYLSFLTKDDVVDMTRARKAMSRPLYRLATEIAFVGEAAENRREQIFLSVNAFPFISHVACPSCLEDAKQSPSAILNERLSRLALAINGSLRDSIMRMAKAEAANVVAHLREKS